MRLCLKVTFAHDDVVAMVAMQALIPSEHLLEPSHCVKGHRFSFSLW